MEIKKSRFVAHLVPFEAHAGFLELQQRLKAEHPKASHVCYAYLGPGGVQRSSDDGEPGGTAGAPILTALKRDPELKNIGCLVVRYFGGTKLGAGGLIRAYAQACREGMAAAREGGFLVEKVERVELLVTVDAASVGVVYKAAQVGSGVVEDEEYLDTGEVRLKLSLVAEEVGRVERVLKDGIAGGVLRWGGGRESR
ncbi:hypothetical protein TeGR_g13561 [Tetraparma gracilis]|uniref:Impact N-terminal domain-containing protein n=1 Tax=Tetraparma gracilis TaxID=2962635 RepID=A0ABQ6N868_9STRA|nr:hypothetical protein TeGR_g13561 [Tetraparma gracilis]